MNKREHRDKIFDAANSYGYEYKGGNKHYKFFHPVTRKTVVVSITPSCHHSTQNALKDLRRNTPGTTEART